MQKPRRLYQKGNYTKIIEELDLVDWDEKFENKSVQEAWDIFKDILKTLIENAYLCLHQMITMIHG